MKQELLMLAGLLSGCATAQTLPEHAEPFAADKTVVWPERPPGQLMVHAFGRSAKSKSDKPMAPWRLYDGQGRPITEVLREDKILPLPAGQYVLVARDSVGNLHEAQVVIGSGAITRISLEVQSQSIDSPYVADSFEW